MDEDMDFLLRSESRTSVLVVLLESQPRPKSAIEQQVSASKRTVSRVLTELVEKGYLRKSQAGYVLTTFGQTVTEAFMQYEERFELADKFRPFLATIDSTAVDIDPTLLRGASLTVADDVDPFAPVDRLLRLREAGSSIRVVSPLVERRSMEQLTDRLDDGEQLAFEAIVPEQLYQRVRAQHRYETACERQRQSESVELFVYPGSVSVLYASIDDTCAVGSTVDDDPHAVVESTDPAFCGWVDDRIEEYKRQAFRLEQHSYERR